MNFNRYGQGMGQGGGMPSFNSGGLQFNNSPWDDAPPPPSISSFDIQRQQQLQQLQQQLSSGQNVISPYSSSRSQFLSPPSLFNSYSNDKPSWPTQSSNYRSYDARDDNSRRSRRTNESRAGGSGGGRFEPPRSSYRDSRPRNVGTVPLSKSFVPSRSRGAGSGARSAKPVPAAGTVANRSAGTVAAQPRVNSTKPATSTPKSTPTGSSELSSNMKEKRAAMKVFNRLTAIPMAQLTGVQKQSLKWAKGVIAKINGSPGRSSGATNTTSGGGGGGTKRTAAESQGNNYPKKQRTTANDNKGAQGLKAPLASSGNVIKMAIFPKEYTDHILQNDDLQIIDDAIVEEMTLGDASKLQFAGITQRKSMLIVDCENQQTADWLKKTTPRLSAWKGVELMACPEADIPQAQGICIFLPKSIGQEHKKSLTLIGVQNEGLNVQNWKVISSRDEADGQSLDILVDAESLQKIKAAKRLIRYRFGKIPVRQFKKPFAALVVSPKSVQTGEKTVANGTTAKLDEKEENTSLSNGQAEQISSAEAVEAATAETDEAATAETDEAATAETDEAAPADAVADDENLPAEAEEDDTDEVSIVKTEPVDGNDDVVSIQDSDDAN